MGNHDYFGDGEPLITPAPRARGRRAAQRRDDASPAATRASSWPASTTPGPAEPTSSSALADRKPGASRRSFLPTTRDSSRSPPSTASISFSAATRTAGRSRFPFLAKFVSLAKLAHRFHLGLYREGDSTLYVHPGLGTTGPPIRVGVAPEVAILTLRAAL